MIDDEFKNWVLGIVNSCYKVTIDGYPNTILYFYDESYSRKKKIFKLNRIDITTPTKVSGYCLFEQNYVNNTLHFNDNILYSMYKKQNVDCENFTTLVINSLNNIGKFKFYISDSCISSDYFFRNNYNRLKVL